MFPKEEVPIGDVVLSVRNLGVDGVFRDVSFELRAGEILGVAGLVGSGRSNVAEALFGVVPATSGEIRIDGKPVRITTPAQAMKHGMAFLTEDRKDTGCFLNLDLLANMEAAVLSHRYVKFNFVRQAQLKRDCEEMSRMLRVKSPGLHEEIQNLSGGNQQKVLIGRWLLTQPRILILDEPTRGIDVGAKAEIHRLVSALAGKGVAVLMISSEMPEVLGMSDRVMVMHEGRMTGIVDRKDAEGPHHGSRVALSRTKIGDKAMGNLNPVADAQTMTLKTRHTKWPPELSIFLVLVGISLFFEIVGWIVVGQSFLFNTERLEIIVLQMAVIGIIAVGVNLVIITSGIDLSSPVVAAAAVVSASLAQVSDFPRAVFPHLTDLPIIWPVLAGVCVGLLVGLLNGSLIAMTGIRRSSRRSARWWPRAASRSGSPTGCRCRC